MMSSSLKASFIELCHLEHIALEKPAKHLLESIDQNDIGAIAQAYGVRHRKISLQANWWKKDCGRILGFDSQGNPLIMTHGRAGYTAYSSQENQRFEVNEGFRDSIQPLGYVFYPSLEAGRITGRTFYHFIRAILGKQLFIPLIWSLLQALCFAALPFILKQLVDNYDRISSSGQIHLFALVLISSQVALWLYGLSCEIILLSLGSKLITTAQSALWDRLLKLPVSFFSRHHPNRLARHCISITRNREMILRSLSAVTTISLPTAVNLLLCFLFAPAAALGISMVILVLVIVSLAFNYKAIELEEKQLAAAQSNSRTVSCLVNAVSTLKTTGNAGHAIDHLLDMNGRAQRLGHRTECWKIFDRIADKLFLCAAMFILFWYHNIAPMASEGTFSAAIMTTALLSHNIGQLLNAVPDLMKGIRIYRDIKPILNSPTETFAKSESFTRLTGAIEFKDVSFSYTTGGPVCKNLSFKIKQGEYVGIIGGSGSGKSTLLKLLLAFEPVGTGRILYDKKDINTLDMTILRGRMGMVLQNDSLPPGTILSTIIGDCADVTMDEVWVAAQAAALAGDIRAMPMGMNTIVNEIKLSGSQRQRILIARALIRKPEILIFDEATSELDANLQKQIMSYIKSMHITRVVVAHRISSIVDCDIVLVMKNQQIIEQGDYQTLMNAKGEFATVLGRQNPSDSREFV